MMWLSCSHSHLPRPPPPPAASSIPSLQRNPSLQRITSFQPKGVDTSLPALKLARENIALNNLDPGKTSFLREDAAVFMKGALSRNESWDIVILYPPKLASRRKVFQSASGMYRNLNSLAMKITRRGGLLMTCSCSGAMT